MRTHVKQPNPHHGHKQRRRFNQAQPVHWILDEAEAALQQAPRVKEPDFAWVMLRLIRLPVTASHFGSEQQLQQVWIKFVGFLSISLYASSAGTSRWLFKRRSGRKRNFFVAFPADIQTRGYLIRIWCPHVTFTSQDGCVCLSFTDGPQENQKHAPNSQLNQSIRLC